MCHLFSPPSSYEIKYKILTFFFFNLKLFLLNEAKLSLFFFGLIFLARLGFHGEMEMS